MQCSDSEAVWGNRGTGGTLFATGLERPGIRQKGLQRLCSAHIIEKHWAIAGAVLKLEVTTHSQLVWRPLGTS